jgi:CHAT domain
VIGTLAPIPDRDAQELFDALHRYLAAGLPAADALRQTQLDAIRMESTTRRTAWRAIALLTRHVA